MVVRCKEENIARAEWRRSRIQNAGAYVEGTAERVVVEQVAVVPAVAGRLHLTVDSDVPRQQADLGSYVDSFGGLLTKVLISDGSCHIDN